MVEIKFSVGSLANLSLRSLATQSRGPEANCIECCPIVASPTKHDATQRLVRLDGRGGSVVRAYILGFLDAAPAARQTALFSATLRLDRMMSDGASFTGLTVRVKVTGTLSMKKKGLGDMLEKWRKIHH